MNVWNHLAVQRSGGTYSIYLNGEIKTIDLFDSPPLSQYTIGASYAPLSYALDGLLQMQFSPSAKYFNNFIPENFDLGSDLNTGEIFRTEVWS
jgi:hypothetical protein